MIVSKCYDLHNGRSGIIAWASVFGDLLMDLHLIIFGDSSAGKLFLDECVSLQFVITF